MSEHSRDPKRHMVENEAFQMGSDESESSTAADASVCPVFLKIMSIAWRCLDTDTTRAIRASSREGRVLFDRMASCVRVVIGPPEEGEPVVDMSPAALSAGLSGAILRGCRPQEVVLSQDNDEDGFGVREQQAVAVLKALATPYLTSVSLTGLTTITPAVAAALSPAATPALTRLAIEFPEAYDVDTHDRGHDAHAFAAVNLLLAAGPRLRKLELLRVDHWPTLVLQALAMCTRLESLEIDMGFAEDDPKAMSDESAMLRAVAAVAGLRSLSLKGGLSVTADDLLRHSSTLRCLSALTALTHLSLELSECHHREDSYSFEPLPQARERWRAAFAQQRSSLRAALRCMPDLRSLDCGGMQLRAKDIAALTALTCLKISGFVMPQNAQRAAATAVAAVAAAAAGTNGGGGSAAAAAGDVAAAAADGGAAAAGAGAGSGPGGGVAAAAAAAAATATGNGSPQPLIGCFPLPPNLQELHFGRPPSPRQLAALHPPLSLRKIVTTRSAWESQRAALAFNVRDVTGAQVNTANRLLPDTPALVAAAAGLLAGRVWAAEGPRRRHVVVAQDSGPGRLQAPEGQAQGHACWLPALAALEVEELVLGDLVLGLRDVLGLVEGLPGLKLLDLRSAWFPMAALPCLAGLRELEEVQISLRTASCSQETAESSLLLLFSHAAAMRPTHGGATAAAAAAKAASTGDSGALLRVRIDRVQSPPWTLDTVRSVQAMLALRNLPGRIVV